MMKSLPLTSDLCPLTSCVFDCLFLASSILPLASCFWPHYLNSKNDENKTPQ